MPDPSTANASVTIKAAAQQVWDALTKPELIKKYFFGTEAKSDWKPGSPVVFKGEWAGKSYEDKGTVLENIPNQRLAYTYWSSMSGTEDKPENYANISYTLEEAGEETKLTISQELKKPEERERSEQNWKMVLDGLKKMLED